MRLPRMTTRRWMIAVGVFALAMGGLVGARAVWQYFAALNRVQFHTGQEEFLRWLVSRPEGAINDIRDLIDKERRITGDGKLHEDVTAGLDESERIMAPLHRQLEYHTTMARKYQGVARFPWLPVAPDPPEPQ